MSNVVWLKALAMPKVVIAALRRLLTASLTLVGYDVAGDDLDSEVSSPVSCGPHYLVEAVCLSCRSAGEVSLAKMVIGAFLPCYLK